MQANHLRWLPARVVHISHMAERIKLFRLFLPSYTRFLNVIPGSYIEVKTPVGLIRQFSLVRCRAEAQEIEIAVLYFVPPVPFFIDGLVAEINEPVAYIRALRQRRYTVACKQDDQDQA